MVTGGGEEISLVTSPGHITIASQAARGNIVEVDNQADNGVIHVIDVVL